MKYNLCNLCKINTTSNKSRKICGDCYQKKHIIVCVECNKSYEVTANYYLKLDLLTHKCKQCKLKGSGNPNFNNKWSDEKKKNASTLVKSLVNDEYRKKCSEGMKGKKVSEETKLKRKTTMLSKYGKLFNCSPPSQETKKKIGEKSKLKFNEEYLKKVRKINEDRGVWIPLEKKDEYKFYKRLSDWRYQVLNENTVGIDKLKLGELYDKKNRNKDSLVRDHMYGRINGFLNGVFPEIIRHPANCQIISHIDNIKKSKNKNDSIITLNYLLERIKKWNINYEEQEICLIFVKKYEEGFRFNKEEYINKIYK
jgi:hypothetical protein